MISKSEKRVVVQFAVRTNCLQQSFLLKAFFFIKLDIQNRYYDGLFNIDLASPILFIVHAGTS